jgi:hypothetical protein
MRRWGGEGEQFGLANTQQREGDGEEVRCTLILLLFVFLVLLVVHRFALLSPSFPRFFWPRKRGREREGMDSAVHRSGRDCSPRLWEN